MKKQFLVITGIFLFVLGVNAQPWTQNILNNGASGNLFGTNTNHPIGVYTNSVQRMHINQNGTTYSSVPTDGYIGIGANPTDVRSRLTITGTNNSGFGGNGFRSWMKTGVFSLENSDNMYVGMKDEGYNRSDAIISFGDDNQGSEFNNFRILYADNGATNDPHLELARYTATGNIGFGPVFTNAAQPQSLLHLNRDGKKETWLQITCQSTTGQKVDDGLRIGILKEKQALIRQQENQPLIIQTDWDNTIGGTNNGERMRITSIGSPGVRNPAGAPNDLRS